MGIDVLVIDDDADLRGPLAELLRDENFLVEERENADDFCEALEQWQPALVLLDLTLPGTDIQAILEKARKRHLTEGRVMLALSGLEDAPKLAEDLGLDGAIRKPFDIDQMLAIVRDAHRRQEAQTTHEPMHPSM